MSMRCSGVAAIFLSLLVTPAAMAEDELHVLLRRPGFEVLKRDPDGTLRAVGKAGVVFERWGGVDAVVGTDNSGRGAVMCAWMLRVEMVGAIEACQLEGQDALRQDLLRHLDAINAFIVENSLEPVSRPELDRRMAERWSRMRGPEKETVCTRSGHLAVVADMARTPRQSLTADVEVLLSVPRPPVMNYCL